MPGTHQTLDKVAGIVISHGGQRWKEPAFVLQACGWPYFMGWRASREPEARQGGGTLVPVAPRPS